MRSKLLSLGVAVLLLGGSSSPALAYSVSLAGGTTGDIVKWPTDNLTYYLHQSCSADLPSSACLDELRASFAAWSSVGCTGITFQELGLSSGLKLTAIGYSTNDMNELAFIENSQWPYGTYTLGVTSPVFWQDGTVIEADIAFNGYLQSWSMSGQSYTTDVMNVAVHEIGHFFGLQHVLGGYSTGDPPTMAPTADPFMASRTPNADDQKGVCFLAPALAYSCSSDDDCPFVVDDYADGQEYYVGQIPCESGWCGGSSQQPPSGDGQLGDTCVHDNDCASPMFCQPLGDGSGVCTTQCQTASPNCPAGFECVAYSNQPSLGVCLEDQGGTGDPKKEVGEPCESSYDCETMLCVAESGGAFCRQQCTSASQCPDGQTCMSLSGVSFGACFEAEEPPPSGGKDIGESCESGAECESGLCAGDGYSFTCTEPCQDQDDCPAGYQCYPLDGGGGGCFKTEGKDVGDSCSLAADCLSGKCVSIGGSPYFCTDVCASTADCPCGMQCISTTDGLYCGPGEKVACVPDGASCAADSECSSGLCADGVCATACSIYQTGGACHGGEGCLRLEAGKPDGTCSPKGSASNGKPCSGDIACESLFCHEGLCSSPCNPFGISYCSEGEVCEVATGDVGVCVAAPPPMQPDPGASGDAGQPAMDAGPTPNDLGGPSVEGGAGAETDTTPPVVWYPGGGSSRGCHTASGATRAGWLALLALLLVGLTRRRR